MSADSTPHSAQDDFETLRSHARAMRTGVWASCYADEVLAAVNRIEEQLRSAETTLAHAEAFIEHQDMSYRWAEWCEGRDPVKAAK